ncbi:hypothetical protein Adt_34146 [Abeliophyllum distichum]|uniref:Uncharacterized protein n=1 Tax=Abeliophyllum distichum TaxID=126358 RepID=A0ABD1QYC1_9LAMI
MPPCLACPPPDMCGDIFKSVVFASIFGFQSWILAGFVSDFFILDFSEIQKRDSDGLLPLLHNDVSAQRTFFAHSSKIRLSAAQNQRLDFTGGVKSPKSSRVAYNIAL